MHESIHPIYSYMKHGSSKVNEDPATINNLIINKAKVEAELRRRGCDSKQLSLLEQVVVAGG